MKRKMPFRKDPPEIGKLIALRRSTQDESSRHLLMKAIWKARKAHRAKCMDARIQDIIQNPQKGRYGKKSEMP
eukprot:121061-Alexandrium_andersonii.AAC.1